MFVLSVDRHKEKIPSNQQEAIDLWLVHFLVCVSLD